MNYGEGKFQQGKVEAWESRGARREEEEENQAQGKVSKEGAGYEMEAKWQEE